MCACFLQNGIGSALQKGLVVCWTRRTNIYINECAMEDGVKRLIAETRDLSADVKQHRREGTIRNKSRPALTRRRTKRGGIETIIS
jgi:hypothetical protein